MLTSEEELWKQAMQLIIPAAPALLTFVMVWIIEIILLNKKIIGWGQEKKIEKAKQSGQVVDATITGSQKSYYYADGSGIEAVRYSYSIKGRRKRTKIVQFRVDGRTTFPETIKIYYPGKRIYTDYDNPKGIPNFLFVALSFIMAMLVLILTQPELIG